MARKKNKKKIEPWVPSVGDQVEHSTCQGNTLAKIVRLKLQGKVATVRLFNGRKKDIPLHALAYAPTNQHIYETVCPKLRAERKHEDVPFKGDGDGVFYWPGASEPSGDC